MIVCQKFSVFPNLQRLVDLRIRIVYILMGTDYIFFIIRNIIFDILVKCGRTTSEKL